MNRINQIELLLDYANLDKEQTAKLFNELARMFMDTKTPNSHAKEVFNKFFLPNNDNMEEVIFALATQEYVTESLAELASDIIDKWIDQAMVETQE